MKVVRITLLLESKDINLFLEYEDKPIGHFTIRYCCIIIKRFARNFLQDIPMKYFAVSFFDNSAAAQNHGG